MGNVFLASVTEVKFAQGQTPKKNRVKVKGGSRLRVRA